MSRIDARQLFEVRQAIVVNGRPAMVLGFGDERRTAMGYADTVHYGFIEADGTVGSGGSFKSYQAEGVKHLDGAKVRTVVDLPEEWQKAVIEYSKPPEVPSDDYEPEHHPSYGACRVSSVTGYTPLFASPFRHMNYVSLEIRRAARVRSSSHDRVSSAGLPELVRVCFSEAQWARLLSSIGNGDGVPCTITRVGPKSMPECPEQPSVERFHDDVAEKVRKATLEIDDAISFARVLAEAKAASKSDRQALVGVLERVRTELRSNMPFVVQSMRERMEEIVCEGKTEVEAFTHRTLSRLGLGALAGSVPVSLGAGREEP